MMDPEAAGWEVVESESSRCERRVAAGDPMPHCEAVAIAYFPRDYSWRVLPAGAPVRVYSRAPTGRVRASELEPFRPSPDFNRGPP